MRKAGLKDLVDRCADLASRGPSVCAYVITYSDKGGTIHTARGGNLAAQVGILAIAKSDLLTDLAKAPKTEDEDA